MLRWPTPSSEAPNFLARAVRSALVASSAARRSPVCAQTRAQPTVTRRSAPCSRIRSDIRRLHCATRQTVRFTRGGMRHDGPARACACPGRGRGCSGCRRRRSPSTCVPARDQLVQPLRTQACVHVVDVFITMLNCDGEYYVSSMAPGSTPAEQQLCCPSSSNEGHLKMISVLLHSTERIMQTMVAGWVATAWRASQLFGTKLQAGMI